MSIFTRLAQVNDYSNGAGSVNCGDTCTKCGTGECTKSMGHSEIAGHRSDGKKGCGHTWGGNSIRIGH